MLWLAGWWWHLFSVALFFKLDPLRMSPCISQCQKLELFPTYGTEKYMFLFLLILLAFPKSSMDGEHNRHKQPPTLQP